MQKFEKAENYENKTKNPGWTNRQRVSHGAEVQGDISQHLHVGMYFEA